MSSLANFLARRAGVVGMGEMADDVFDHDDRAVHYHAEVQCAERQQVGGDFVEIQANGGEQKCKGNGERDDDCAAHVAKEQEKNYRYKNHALGEIVLDGLYRV